MGLSEVDASPYDTDASNSNSEFLTGNNNSVVDAWLNGLDGVTTYARSSLM